MHDLKRRLNEAAHADEGDANARIKLDLYVALTLYYSKQRDPLQARSPLQQQMDARMMASGKAQMLTALKRLSDADARYAPLYEDVIDTFSEFRYV